MHIRAKEPLGIEPILARSTALITHERNHDMNVDESAVTSPDK